MKCASTFSFLPVGSVFVRSVFLTSNYLSTNKLVATALMHTFRRINLAISFILLQESLILTWLLEWFL